MATIIMELIIMDTLIIVLSREIHLDHSEMRWEITLISLKICIEGLDLPIYDSHPIYLFNFIIIQTSIRK